MAAYKTPLIWYMYDRKDNGGCQLRGCVVKTPEGKIGYSWAHKNDLRKVTKKLARAIAFGRAAKCSLLRDWNGWRRERGPGGKILYPPRELDFALDALAGV